MIRVFHAPNEVWREAQFRDGVPLNVLIAGNFDKFRCVAEVATDDVEVAYMLTNTIDALWWENDRVKFLGSNDHGMKGCRSTSVGDVLVVYDDADNAVRKSIVARCGTQGFRPMPSNKFDAGSVMLRNALQDVARLEAEKAQLRSALEEFVDAESALQSTVREPTNAWRIIEQRYRVAKAEVQNALKMS